MILFFKNENIHLLLIRLQYFACQLRKNCVYIQNIEDALAFFESENWTTLTFADTVYVGKIKFCAYL